MQLDLDRSTGGRLDEGSGGQTSGHQLHYNARLAIQDLAKKVAYPNDPDQVDWSYTQGTELVELGDYYERLVSWYVRCKVASLMNGDTVQHKSGHHFKFDYWQVFNEIEAEHSTTPEQYSQRYDAVVKAVRKVCLI